MTASPSEGRSGPPDPLDLSSLADDARERPAFAPAHRARLDDRDRVAGLRFVQLVVHHELRRAPFGLAVESVPHLPLDRDHAALLHSVADDDANLFRLFR